jgi:D-threo-aldose 1-dehydrogenase
MKNSYRCAPSGVYTSRSAESSTAGCSRAGRRSTTALRRHIAARAKELENSCRRYGVPLPAVALQFSLGHPAISSILIGGRSAEEITQDVSWINQPIPDELWRDPLFHR